MDQHGDFTVSLATEVNTLYSRMDETDLYILENTTREFSGSVQAGSFKIVQENRIFPVFLEFAEALARIRNEVAVGGITLPLAAWKEISIHSTDAIAAVDAYIKLLLSASSSTEFEHWLKRSLTSKSSSEAVMEDVIALQAAYSAARRVSALLEFSSEAVLATFGTTPEEGEELRGLLLTRFRRSSLPWGAAILGIADKMQAEAKARGHLLVFDFLTFEGQSFTFQEADAHRDQLADRLRFEDDALSSPSRWVENPLLARSPGSVGWSPLTPKSMITDIQNKMARQVADVLLDFGFQFDIHQTVDVLDIVVTLLGLCKRWISSPGNGTAKAILGALQNTLKGSFGHRTADDLWRLAKNLEFVLGPPALPLGQLARSFLRSDRPSVEQAARLEDLRRVLKSISSSTQTEFRRSLCLANAAAESSKAKAKKFESEQGSTIIAGGPFLVELLVVLRNLLDDLPPSGSATGQQLLLARDDRTSAATDYGMLEALLEALQGGVPLVDSIRFAWAGAQDFLPGHMVKRMDSEAKEVSARLAREKTVEEAAAQRERDRVAQEEQVRREHEAVERDRAEKAERVQAVKRAEAERVRADQAERVKLAEAERSRAEQVERGRVAQAGRFRAEQAAASERLKIEQAERAVERFTIEHVERAERLEIEQVKRERVEEARVQVERAERIHLAELRQVERGRLEQAEHARAVRELRLLLRGVNAHASFKVLEASTQHLSQWVSYLSKGLSWTVFENKLSTLVSNVCSSDSSMLFRFAQFRNLDTVCLDDIILWLKSLRSNLSSDLSMESRPSIVGRALVPGHQPPVVAQGSARPSMAPEEINSIEGSSTSLAVSFLLPNNPPALASAAPLAKSLSNTKRGDSPPLRELLDQFQYSGTVASSTTSALQVLESQLHDVRDDILQLQGSKLSTEAIFDRLSALETGHSATTTGLEAMSSTYQEFQDGISTLSAATSTLPPIGVLRQTVDVLQITQQAVQFRSTSPSPVRASFGGGFRDNQDVPLSGTRLTGGARSQVGSCWAFAKGNYKKGDKCRFQHTPSDSLSDVDRAALRVAIAQVDVCQSEVNALVPGSDNERGEATVMLINVLQTHPVLGSYTESLVEDEEWPRGAFGLSN